MKRRITAPVVDVYLHPKHFEARVAIGMKSDGAHEMLRPMLNKPLDFTWQR